jgi:hypothetical protein
VLSKYTKKFSKSPYKVFAYKTNTDPTMGVGYLTWKVHVPLEKCAAKHPLCLPITTYGFFSISKSAGRQSSVSRGHITKQNFFFGSAKCMASQKSGRPIQYKWGGVMVSKFLSHPWFQKLLEWFRGFFITLPSRKNSWKSTS